MPRTDDFSYEMDPNVDEILEEHANTYIALRKIKWGNSKNYKIDIRKYTATESGERMLKGCSLTDEGVNELVTNLIRLGYGKDDAIQTAINESRPELVSRFIEDFSSKSPEELQDHLTKYPVVYTTEDDSEEDYCDLDEVL